MPKQTYTPDAKGVAQWLKDNPTKKNKRGRNVRTGLRDGYKAVGYEGPPLKIKEGNLTNNRNRIRLSLRGDAGDAARSASARPFTKQEFLEFGKRNGYTTAQSTKIFEQFVTRNRAQKASILPGQANDHVTPNSASFYQAGENYRNRVGLSTKVNLLKSNKMPTPSEMRSVGIPTTRSSLIQKEFANAPAPDPKALRSLASKVARDSTRPRAKGETNRLNTAQQRRFDSYFRKLAKKPFVGQPMYGANLASLAINYLPMIDEMTGGHLDKAVTRGIESLKLAGKQAFNAGVSKMVENRGLGYDLYLGQ